jgi:hypothetical protein
MRFFVVRHKTTQRLLPQSYAVGSTWWNPEEQPIKKDELPRLFYTAKGAKACIVMWAKGQATKQTDRHGDFLGEDDAEWLWYEPVPGRSREQREVVPVHLVFGEPK